jgi:hypothetical protein
MQEQSKNSSAKLQLGEMNVREELLCPVCLVEFNHDLRRPMVLPSCGHTICKDCIPQLPTNNCVVCQTHFDRDTCVVNYALEMVIQSPKLLADDSKVIVDDQFEAIVKPPERSVAMCCGCELKPASFHCKQCGRDRANLCDECDKVIHSLRVFSLHERVQVDQAETTTPECTEHKNEPLKFFCDVCSKAVCKDCTISLLGKHSSHPLMTLDKAMDKIDSSTTNGVKRFLDSVNSYVNELSEISTKVQTLLEQETVALNLKRNAVQSMAQEVRKEEQSLSLLKSQLDADLEKLNSVKSQQVDHLAVSEELKSRVEQLVNRYKQHSLALQPFFAIFNAAALKGYGVQLPKTPSVLWNNQVLTPSNIFRNGIDYAQVSSQNLSNNRGSVSTRGRARRSGA